MVAKPKDMITQASVSKALSICDSLDEKPELWTVYGETIRHYFNAMAATLDYQYERWDKLRGRAGNRNRYNEVMSLRGRQGNLKKRVWKERPHVCERCGCSLSWPIAVPHHVIPVADGGSDADDNVELICANCHRQEHYA